MSIINIHTAKYIISNNFNPKKDIISLNNDGELAVQKSNTPNLLFEIKSNKSEDLRISRLIKFTIKNINFMQSLIISESNPNGLKPLELNKFESRMREYLKLRLPQVEVVDQEKSTKIRIKTKKNITTFIHDRESQEYKNEQNQLTFNPIDDLRLLNQSKENSKPILKNKDSVMKESRDPSMLLIEDEDMDLSSSSESRITHSDSDSEDSFTDEEEITSMERPGTPTPDSQD